MEIKVENGIILIKPPGADDFDELCEDFEVTKHVDLLTQKETLNFVIHKPYGEKVFDMPRRELAGKNLFSRFLDYGLTVIDCDATAEYLKFVIFEKERSFNPTFQHSGRGFVKTSTGDEIFLGEHPIGKGLNELQEKSTYTGDSLAPKGSFKTWRKFLITHVVTRTSLCLAMALGATAPLAHMLKKAGIFVDVPLWSLIGDSSTGKTCTLTMLTSAFADPSESIYDFNSTTNAFYARLQSCNGAYPFSIDEGTYTARIDWDELLYALPAGREKGRVKSDGTLKESSIFSGAVIMTSESSILERSSMLPDQQVRIIEFEQQWFKNGTHANDVRSFCSKNYGHLTHPFFTLLMSKGFDIKLVKKFKFFCNDLRQTVDSTCGKDARLIERYALILLSAWMISKAAKVDFHVDSLKSLLVEHFSYKSNEMSQYANHSSKLYNGIIEEILSHLKMFPPMSRLKNERRFTHEHPIWGAIDNDESSRGIWILQNRFYELISHNTNLGRRNALKELEKLEVLKRSYDDRFVFENVEFGIFTANAYFLRLKGSPSLIEQILSIEPAKRCNYEIEKKLNFDAAGCFTEASQPQLYYNYDTPELRFERHGSKMELILNKEILEKLDLNDCDVYIYPLISKGYLILSTTEIIKNSLFLKLEHSNVLAKNRTSNIKKLVDMMNFKLENNEIVLLYDIKIEEHDNKKCAIVDFKASGSIHRYKETPSLPTNKKLTPQMESLLSTEA